MNPITFSKSLEEHNIVLSDNQLQQFALYYEMLTEWNKKINLTAITEENEAYLKHLPVLVFRAFL